MFFHCAALAVAGLARTEVGFVAHPFVFFRHAVVFQRVVGGIAARIASHIRLEIKLVAHAYHGVPHAFEAPGMGGVRVQHVGAGPSDAGLEEHPQLGQRTVACANHYRHGEHGTVASGHPFVAVGAERQFTRVGAQDVASVHIPHF